jgi:hypothetical protein
VAFFRHVFLGTDKPEEHVEKADLHPPKKATNIEFSKFNIKVVEAPAPIALQLLLQASG